MLRVLLLAALLPAASAAETLALDNKPPEWVKSARLAAAELGGQLKGELTAAIAESGPSGGVSVCRDRAPAIASSLSTDDFNVGRTALRVRNPKNAPGPWERSILEDFQSGVEQGNDPSKMEHWQVFENSKGKIGRWMKAIPMGPECAACHGSRIAEPIAETIERLYPEDQATGFQPGELRGAFTVRIDLPRPDSETGAD